MSWLHEQLHLQWTKFCFKPFASFKKENVSVQTFRTPKVDLQTFPWQWEEDQILFNKKVGAVWNAEKSVSDRVYVQRNDDLFEIAICSAAPLQYSLKR